MTEFRVGDEVFGDQGRRERGVRDRARERRRSRRSRRRLTYEEAAAVPDGSLLALTCLRPAYPLQGKSVLVYGAAGSVGTAAVQLLAHHFEAEVTAVCDTKDVELVRSLGARDVLDRLREDFTKNGETYDVIFDAVGKHSFRRCRRSLKPRRDLHLDGPRVHVPPAAPRSRHAVRRQQAGEARDRPLSQGGPPPRQGARRDGQVPAGDRPDATRSTRSSRRPATSRAARRRATSCSASARLRPARLRGVKPRFFATPDELRAWLEANHDSESEVPQEAHRPPLADLDRVRPRGALLRLDRRREAADRRRQLLHPLHAAQAVQQLKRRQRPARGGADPRGARIARLSGRKPGSER